jgi:TolB-like protein/DNA-binding winged helix-turn-helix (wHTH) protein
MNLRDRGAPDRVDFSVKDKGVVGFGPFQLDAGRRRLTRGGEVIKLPAKQLDTLLYFVENPNRVIEKDELLAAVWPGRIAEEGSLSQTIYLLRRALQADEAERYIVAVPGRGYRFVADVVRPPEGSPGGMMPAGSEPPDGTAKIPRPVVSRAGYPRWAPIAGVVGTLVILGVAAWAFRRAPAPPGEAAFNPPPHAVAVLAFTNMSGDPGQEYLSDGISEEIINALSRINGLQVSARMSAFSFKGGNATIGEIARKLNVGAILEGSVRRDGARLRVTVQLINATTGYQYWSRSFDREKGGMLQLEADIAGAVAQSLEITLLGPEAARLTAGGTKNPLAFDAYLRGSSLARTFDLASARAALPAFEAAIRLDPSFADAHAGLAFTLITIAIQDSTGDPPFAQVSAQALAEADRAVELAPESARAHAVRGGILHWRLDLTGAAAEVAQARALDGADILVERTYAMVEADLGRFAQAEDAARHMVALDPLTPAEYYFLAVYLDYNRKYAEALEVLRRETALGVVNPYRTALMTALAHQGLGDWAAAIQDCRAFPQDTCLAVTAIAEMKLGQVAQAHQAMAKLEAADGLSIVRAEVYAQWNDRPAALHWLDVATREHSPALSQIRQFHDLDPVRDSPQYKNLERSIGLVP